MQNARISRCNKFIWAAVVGLSSVFVTVGHGRAQSHQQFPMDVCTLRVTTDTVTGAPTPIRYIDCFYGAQATPNARFHEASALFFIMTSDDSQVRSEFGPAFVTANTVDTYIANYLANNGGGTGGGTGGGQTDILDVIDQDIARDAFLFGFFSVITVWLIGFGVGMARRLLVMMSTR